MSRSSEISFRQGDSFRDRQNRAPSAAAGVRRCARGEWCATSEQAAREDGSYGRRAAEIRTGTYCAADEQIIAGCLRDADPKPDEPKDLPVLHTALAVAALTEIRGEVAIRVPFGPSVLVRLDVDDLWRWMADAIAHWHERVAFAGHLATPDTLDVSRMALTTRAGTQLAGSVRILLGHLPRLLELPPEPAGRPRSQLLAVIHPGAPVVGGPGTDRLLVELDGAAAGREIMRLQYVARAVLGLTDPPVEKLLGVPCRRCRRDDEPIGPLSLVAAPPPQHDGDPVYKSQCTRCGHLQTPGEFKEWVGLNAAWLRGRVTPAQYATLPPDLRALVIDPARVADVAS